MIFLTTLALMLATEAGDMSLEEQLRAGLISPEEAVAIYCAKDSHSMRIDAFCACPEEAIDHLRKALEPPLTN
ncbi:MAG: hypothetical protein GY807_16870 [Gammaproteobacteria bacterium]|nr:hypothetical protein [Gammaproteobacteria bacterium]